MNVLGAAFLLLVLLVLFGAAFLRADAARLAAGLRLVGPAFLVFSGLALLMAGPAAAGGMLFAAGLAWGASIGRRKRPASRRCSTVRTAALEMELDHRSGRLEGLVLAGTFEGKVLGRLHGPQLRRLYAELASDGESRLLLESYLDGRFPGWREDAQLHVHGGQRVAPGPGAMTKEEAYKILGLETGAPAADVRKAHRRLMQRLHPRIGTSSFLAARINEAKDVLLSDHG